MLEPPVPPTRAEERELLRPIATQLIWWQPAEQALQRPDRVIAQVMDIGNFETVQILRQNLGDRRLAQVLQQAEAGWFSPRSWTYWHRKLGVTPTGPVPPLATAALPRRMTLAPRLDILPPIQRQLWPLPCAAATKLKVLLQRAERKDYDDVAVLLASGLTLAEGLGAARALYGSAFPIMEALKALVYFADGDLGDLRMPFHLWSTSIWS